MAQTNLERLGISERTNQLTKAEYTNINQYDESHADAKSPNSLNAKGEEKGKGTGTPMGYYTLPSTKNPAAGIDYSKINTATGGSAEDITARIANQTRNLYNPTNFYDASAIDTSANVAEGQVVIS